jgi:GNAT superfamily N-acetyltransferase
VEFLLREMSQEDAVFIYSSYLQSYRRNHPMCRVPQRRYYIEQTKTLRWLLGHAQAVVACFPEEAEQIAGYCLWQRLQRDDATMVLHWLYVKADLRRKGVGRQLIEATIGGSGGLIVGTHMVDAWTLLKRSLLRGHEVTYDPFLIPGLMLQSADRSAL